MGLQALGQQVLGWRVVGIVGDFQRFARGAAHRLVAGDQLLDHAAPIAAADRRAFLDRGQAGELGEAGGRIEAQRADALGDLVQCVPLFGVLGFEHGVQGVEHRPGHVPVEVVGLQVQGEGVGQEVRQAGRDLLAVAGGDADVDARGRARRLGPGGCSGLAGRGLALGGCGLCHGLLLGVGHAHRGWGCDNGQ